MLIELLSFDIIEDEADTTFDKVHVFPLIFTIKLAVPLDVGVPETLNVKFPEVAENVPAEIEAVNPKTPVEDAFTALYELPDVAPVYGRVKDTPEATAFCCKVPVEVALAQVKAKLLAVLTLIVCVHEAPLTVKAKLAVPEPEGVPETLNVKFPDVPEYDPADNVAVNPVTPVEDELTALYEAPDVAPVYGTEKDTPEAAVPLINDPEVFILEHVRAKVEATFSL